MTDFVVLAKYAAEVTVGHENCSGTAPAYQGILLPKVRTVAGNHRLATGIAHT
jgi:hypothetical protein